MNAVIENPLDECPKELKNRIPSRTFGAISQHVMEGLLPDGFLFAVLSNDLSLSVMRADEENRLALLHIMRCLWNYVPGECWGSPGKVFAWEESRGLLGRARDLEG